MTGRGWRGGRESPSGCEHNEWLGKTLVLPTHRSPTSGDCRPASAAYGDMADLTETDSWTLACLCCVLLRVSVVPPFVLRATWPWLTWSLRVDLVDLIF